MGRNAVYLPVSYSGEDVFALVISRVSSVFFCKNLVYDINGHYLCINVNRCNYGHLKVNKMKKLCYPVLAFFLIMNFGTSCRKQQKEIQAAHIVEISDDDLKNTASRASEIFDSVEFVFLETNEDCLMGRVSKVIVTEDCFILKSAKAVFIFDRQGHFIRKIHHVGRGNGEYIGLDYISLLSDGNLILLDTENKKMLGYNMSDSLLFDIKLPFFPRAVEERGDGMLVFAVAGRDDHIIVWNRQKGEIQRRLLPFNIKYAITIARPLLKYGGDVYFTQEYRPGLFKVEDNGLTWQWYIDAGDRTIQGEDLKPVDFFGATVYAPGPQKARIGGFFESDKVLFFEYQCEEQLGESVYNVFYSKKTGNMIVYNPDKFMDDVSFYSQYYNYMFMTSDNQFVCVFDAGIWTRQVEEYAGKVVELGLEKKYVDILPKISGLSPDDNPVLALFKIKDF